MLDTQTIDGTDIVTATYSGALGADETAQLREKIEEVIGSQGSARLLVEIRDLDLGRVEPKAVWEDMKSARLLDDVSRMAMVADDSFLSGATEALGKLASTETKTFSADERDHALVWLKE